MHTLANEPVAVVWRREIDLVNELVPPIKVLATKERCKQLYDTFLSPH